MKISLIAALSENRVIGVGNKLPWHISEDLKRFKRLTSGHPVIMGRKTFESIGRALPNRTNIIITRDVDFKAEGCIVVHSLEEAIAKASQSEGNDEVYIIGGGQIFSQAIGKADRLYLTIVHTTLDGDAYFPEYSGFTKEIERQDKEDEKYHYTFLTLEK